MLAVPVKAKTTLQSDPGCSVLTKPLVKIPPTVSTQDEDCGQVDVSPGMYDQKLGVDFPTFSAVKLSYPNSTILTKSIGDLLFTVTLSPPKSDRVIDGVPSASFYSSVDVYIPPDFSGLKIDKVWTSFTNNYDPNSLSLSRLSPSDRIGPNWWKVSVKNLIVTADSSLISSNSGLTAHRVFAADQSQYIRLFQVVSPSIAGRYFFKALLNGTSVGAANFPTVVVKASINPAYISGTLRDAGNVDPNMEEQPITLPEGFGAQVLATGRDYLGKPVAAQTFINSMAQGQYTLFGVAPGTYNITAYAAGFIPTTRPITVSVLAAQSLEGIDVYLPHSVNVTGTVLSLGADGIPIPWGPLYGFGGASDRSIAIRVLTLDSTTVASTPAPYRPVLFTNRIATEFGFAIRREVGFDGRIPQDFANYTSGITPGDYRLRAFVTSYVQFDDVVIHVSNDTITTRSTIRLIRGGFFSVTIHFKDFNSTLADSPIPASATLSVQAYDRQGISRGSNVTFVPAGSTQATIEILGLSESRSFGVTGLLPPNGGLLPGTYYIYARLTSSPSFTGFANIGIRDLYIQINDFQGTVALASSLSYNSPTELSLPMIRAGGIILTIYSVDKENPAVARPWAFPGAGITFKIIDSVGTTYQANATQPVGSAQLQILYSGLLTNDYEIMVETVGYSQRDVPRTHVVLGINNDASVWMIQEPIIDLTMVFKTEHLLSPIDSTQPYSMPLNHLDSTPARIEVYNSRGNLAGANITYIPNLTDGIPTTTARVLLFGFNRYFGDHKQAWAGFYDTTDAARQDEGGLPPGDYTIIVWVDGYYQVDQITTRLPERGVVSLVVSMERASRISGIVLGLDLYDEAVFLSWAVVDVEPGNFTTYSLDGFYQLWTPAGSYQIGSSLAGYSTQSMRLEVPPGSDLTVNFWLSNIQTILEFSNLTLPLTAITVALTLAIIRRRLTRRVQLSSPHLLL